MIVIRFFMEIICKLSYAFIYESKIVILYVYLFV